MNKADAYDKLEALVLSYKSRFETVGARSEHEVYFLNAKSFKEAAADEEADSLCASVTLVTASGEDACGFDITADIDKRGEVDEKKLNSAIDAFTRDADEFLKEIAVAENKDKLIKDAAEQEKARFQASADAFDSDIKKLRLRTVILSVIAVAVIFFAVFAFIEG